MSTTGNDDFEYDVAFSFLAGDEHIATELHDLVADNFKCFLYSRKQGELAGTDGEKTFNKVFGEKARLVVVLCRAEWGNTPWTRIEETAIKNRAFDAGYDFTLFVPLNNPPVVPKWVPKTQLWAGYARWGASGIAAVIEQRVQSLGGAARTESVTDHAARIDRKNRFEKERTERLNSDAGVKASDVSYDQVLVALETLVERIHASAPTMGMRTKRVGKEFAILAPRAALSIYWTYHYSNSLEGSELRAAIWKGHPPMRGVMTFEEPRQLSRLEFDFDFYVAGEFGWTARSDKRQFSAEQLAEFLLKYLLDCQER